MNPAPADESRGEPSGDAARITPAMKSVPDGQSGEPQAARQCTPFPMVSQGNRNPPAVRSVPDG